MPLDVGIIGSGSIGVAWAIVFARSGSAVALQDPDRQRLELAPQELRARLDELAGFGLLGEPPAAIAARVRTTTGVQAAVTGAGYVQECAPESLGLKQELFAELDRLAAPDAILASSSSAITASAIAAELP